MELSGNVGCISSETLMQTGSKLPKADMERRPQKLPLFTTRIRASGRSLKRFTACWPRLCKSVASVLATLAVAAIWARN